MSDPRKYCSEKCPRFSANINSPCLWGCGSKSAKIMFVGRDPGQKEDLRGEPFIGNSGELLNEMLAEIGVQRSDVYITNVVKCAYPKKNKAPGKKEISSCRFYIEQEIGEIKPNVVVALGAEALECVLKKSGITKFKNNVFFSKEFGVKVIPMFHPSHILRNPDMISDLRDGFQLLTNEMGSKEIAIKSSVPVKILVADTDEKISKVMDKLETVNKFVFDLETSSLEPSEARIGIVAISWCEDLGITVKWDRINEKNMQRFSSILRSGKLKINHNIKYDLEVLLAHKIQVKGPFFCTMVAHSLIDENSGHGLGDCTLRYLDMGEYWADLDAYKEEREKELKREINYLEIPDEILDPYAANDSVATFRLAKIFVKMLKNQKLFNYMNKYTMKVMPVYTEMEMRGIRIQREKMKELAIEYEEKLKELNEKIYKVPEVEKFEDDRMGKGTRKIKNKYKDSKILKSRFKDVKEYIKKSLKEKDWKFNPNSPPQMRELFFGKKYLALKPFHKTDGGSPSADKETLEKFAKKGIKLAESINEYRKLSAYISNFINVIYEGSARDGRIHTNYLQHVVVTGRAASRAPNLQNLPTGGDKIKDCFLADPGFKFVKGDLAQAEFRCWAHYSEDEDLIRDIESGMDIHSITASEVFGYSVEEIMNSDKLKDECRYPAKRGTFGMMFGVSARHLADEFDIPLERAEAILKTIYSKYPTAVNWLEEQVWAVRKHGYLRSWLGRKRRLPKIKSKDDNERSGAERQAKNCRIQMLATAMNDHYMVTTLKRARKETIRCFPCMTIHDANVYQVKENMIDDFVPIMHDVVATEFPGFKCTMKLDIEIGDTLGSLKEIG